VTRTVKALSLAPLAEVPLDDRHTC
jgi:hypothetical protein